MHGPSWWIRQLWWKGMLGLQIWWFLDGDWALVLLTWVCQASCWRIWWDLGRVLMLRGEARALRMRKCLGWCLSSMRSCGKWMNSPRNSWGDVRYLISTRYVGNQVAIDIGMVWEDRTHVACSTTYIGWRVTFGIAHASSSGHGCRSTSKSRLMWRKEWLFFFFFVLFTLPIIAPLFGL